MKSIRIGVVAVALTVVIAGVGGLALCAQEWMQADSQATKVLLDNARVRVVEVTLAAREKSPVHTHPANFGYLLTGGKARVSYVGGESQEFELKKGEVVWSDPEGPHTIENMTGGTLSFLLVELKDYPYTPKAASR